MIMAVDHGHSDWSIDTSLASDPSIRSGAEGDRTLNLSIANAALSQLSYRPYISYYSACSPIRKCRGRQCRGKASQCRSQIIVVSWIA